MQILDSHSDRDEDRKELGALLQGGERAGRLCQGPTIPLPSHKIKSLNLVKKVLELKLENLLQQ